MRIIGIDPGSAVCGYGIVEKSGSRLVAVESGAVRLAGKGLSLADRLKEIFYSLDKIVKDFTPDAAAIEATFYAKNAQSLIKLSHARAAAMLACSVNSLPIDEFSPREIKKAVTGRGAAGKEQVRFMVSKTLALDVEPKPLDVSDALAVAICRCMKPSAARKSAKSWEDFIKNNPERIARI